MAHTNSTTHYSLPQFVTTDKPAWLTDVNNAYTAIDTAIYNAKSAADSAQSDATAAGTTATAASTAAAAADAKGAGAVASLADAFLSSTTYSVGELVTYNNLLYVCTVAVTTPGDWTGSTNWSRINVENAIPKSASELPYSEGVSTKQAIDSKGFAPAELTISNYATGVTGSSFGYKLSDNLLLVVFDAKWSANQTGFTKAFEVAWDTAFTSSALAAVSADDASSTYVRAFWDVDHITINCRAPLANKDYRGQVLIPICSV